jgi:cell division protein FtsI (penicillin-binding protein 3)
MAEIIGKKNQKDFFKKIGFTEKIDIQLLEVAKPMGNMHNWGPIETMTIGYGHGYAITPLHLITAYCIISNKGKKIKPKIFLDEKNLTYSEQIVGEETSNYILSLLRAVVTETKFTGSQIKIEGYEIGGKTGTADLVKDGTYQKEVNLTSFLGIFPISNPKYAVLAIIENPKKTKKIKKVTGATVSTPLVKKIIVRMIEIFNLPRIINDEILNAATTINNINKNVIN